jgi:hypothetical protein
MQMPPPRRPTRSPRSCCLGDSGKCAATRLSRGCYIGFQGWRNPRRGLLPGRSRPLSADTRQDELLMLSVAKRIVTPCRSLNDLPRAGRFKRTSTPSTSITSQAPAPLSLRVSEVCMDAPSSRKPSINNPNVRVAQNLLRPLGWNAGLRHEGASQVAHVVEPQRGSPALRNARLKMFLRSLSASIDLPWPSVSGSPGKTSPWVVSGHSTFHRLSSGIR